MSLTVKTVQLDNVGNYIESSYEADLSQVCLLLENLKGSKTSLHFQSEYFCVDFNCLSETTFEVEIFDVRDGFWAISEVDMVAARKIAELVAENAKFGEIIPTTNELWGAYGGGEFA